VCQSNGAGADPKPNFAIGFGISSASGRNPAVAGPPERLNRTSLNIAPERRDVFSRRSTNHVCRTSRGNQFDVAEELRGCHQPGNRPRNKTLRQVKSAWVKEQEAEIDHGKVVAYKVNLKVTFVLDGQPV